jgi:hypothetical protein
MADHNDPNAVNSCFPISMSVLPTSTTFSVSERGSQRCPESRHRADLHHLADYYSDVMEDGVASVKWAHKDLRLRENLATQAARAWAVYRDGQFSDVIR